MFPPLDVMHERSDETLCKCHQTTSERAEVNEGKAHTHNELNPYGTATAIPVSKALVRM
jgi:hypothetical protein